MVSIAWAQAMGQPEKKTGRNPKGAKAAEKSATSGKGFPFTAKQLIRDVRVCGKKPLVPEAACMPKNMTALALPGYPTPGTGPNRYPERTSTL
jgi:hypothetical protein